MKINIAKSAGFCFGVKRAVDTVYKESSKKNVYTFGPIIHNDEVVADLERQGVHVINDSEDFKSLSEGTIIIRSHGVSKAIYDEILNAGLDLVDATCPFVRKIHKIVERDVFNQLAIEHEVIAKCLVDGLKEGSRRSKGALVGVTSHSGKRLFDRIDDHLDHIGGDGIEQAVDRAKMHVEGLTIDICLTRDGTHGNIGKRFIHQQALKRRKDGIAAANDAAVEARFAGVHGRVPSECEHSSTDES